MHHDHYRAAVLALSMLGSHAGHETGDYLVQRDCDAQAKQKPTPQGRRSLARHATTYAATQLATQRRDLPHCRGPRSRTGPAGRGGHRRITHAVIDDGRLLARFAEATGKGRFHDLADHGVNGRALMDQAAHKGVQIPLGAVVTTAVAAALGRKGVR
jgi:hypothetical protein